MKSLLLGVLLVAGVLPISAGKPRTLDEFRAASTNATNVRARLMLPEVPQTPVALGEVVAAAIREADDALDRIAHQDAGAATFQSTVVALDTLIHTARTPANLAAFIQETHPDAAMRAAGAAAVKAHQDWLVGVDYREDVHQAIQRFAVTRPTLAGEDVRLLAETLRAYHRAGLDLPPTERAPVAELRRELARRCADFDANLTGAQAVVVFTRVELEGVPDTFLTSPGVQTGEDAFSVRAHLGWQAYTVLDHAKRETTRRRLLLARDRLAKEKNVPLLNRILALRQDLARRLGYRSWADYQTEVKLAKTGVAAERYIRDLAAGVQPKFDAEVAELRRMKAAETGDPNARIAAWDWRYYTNRLRQERFALDVEELRVFFPLPQVLAGMFDVCGRIFGLNFEPLAAAPGASWPTADVSLYAVSDRATGEPLGLFYLDLLPREGKSSAGGESELVGGRLLDAEDGGYQRPTVALVCSFSPPAADGEPSLLGHAEVEVLFHEFGHALHAILTRAKYARFAGTNVPGDFVEAPSQMLQNWVWNQAVLDTFAADYRDPARKIPAETIARLKAARQATAGVFYRRQFAFALLDLALHGAAPPPSPPEGGNTSSPDCVATSNRILGEVFLPVDPVTAFVASFRALNGYDAGYYGYAWADAIAADLASVFESAPDGYLDREAGGRLRREIYEPGGSREVSESIRRFLGRAPSVTPFLNKVGIGEPGMGAPGPRREHH